MTVGAIRVLLADDHGAIRAGLRIILDGAEGIEVVGEAADGDVAVAQARALRPDVVLMDIRMPGVDGITATTRITADNLAKVLVLTTFDLDEYVFRSLRAGASGFVLKSVSGQALVDAVRRVAAGDGVLAPEVTRTVIEAFATAPAEREPPQPDGLADLTDREREVFDCLGAGLSNAEIAAHLFIGETTVKTHVSRVLTKLGLRSRVQAAILAGQVGDRRRPHGRDSVR
ncbi:response regulator [Nocardia donostiensis]|uniref:DNA-binding response regulator n=1 Tax=Nocardia donostiensis TaxID=1538463 RepID=A0A1W0ATZ1_9NOCA|nr:response regulator transcription factor [Nocardia donostiensis]ONM47743.1 DNA-binding response regulator [Nocardia donostiensis]OQS13674.1 DNA-binding response regulator [Nocardia donostiensis]OQS22495.1 DNA-binding response regulator [Nocardia donostiensis]